ncbi:hypothetical protein [Lacrimispora sp.]|uniref:hypothetical protein n=1 Tax=Lacrimispora sp. TaxID=2719234 RepID=UPI003993A8A0
MEYGFDIINGNKVQQMIINGDHELLNKHEGTIHVESGTLKIAGEVSGTLDVQMNTKVIILGKQRGTVSIAENGNVEVFGKLYGTVSVSQGGTLIIHRGAKVFGTLSNNGEVVVRGELNGVQTGIGSVHIEDNGYIRTQ